jgi:hypothetical protein
MQHCLTSTPAPNHSHTIHDPDEDVNLYMYDYDSPAATQIQADADDGMHEQAQSVVQTQAHTQMQTQTETHTPMRTHTQTQPPAGASLAGLRDMQVDNNEQNPLERLYDNGSSSSSPFTYAREFANLASNVQKATHAKGARAASEDQSTSAPIPGTASNDIGAERLPLMNTSDQLATQPKRKYVWTEERRARHSEVQRANWARRKAAAAQAGVAPASVTAMDDRCLAPIPAW